MTDIQSTCVYTMDDKTMEKQEVESLTDSKSSSPFW